MKALHIVPEVNEANGVWRVASLLAQEQGGVAMPSFAPNLRAAIADAEEVWVHGAWLPRLWLASLAALRSGRRLVRMTHGALSPIYLRRQSPVRKRLVSPVERFFLRHADHVVATCAAEADWIRAYEPHVKRIETTELKRFFKLPGRHPGGEAFQAAPPAPPARPLHLLYLGRRHPLKGVHYLEAAAGEVNNSSVNSVSSVVELKIVTSAFGAEKEAAFDWCDVLALPSLSENFGLVVAEALERGKRVIVTDGAPAWEPEGREGVKLWKCENMAICGRANGKLLYLEGFRDGTDEMRVRLLREALLAEIGGFQ